MGGNLIIEPAGNDDYTDEEVGANGNYTMSGDTADQGPYISLLEPFNNLTRKTGQTVKIKCQVEGTLPVDFRWFKNDAPLLKEKGKINVIDRDNWSRLRINNLNPLDTGYYKCEASNKGGKVETTSLLKVTALINKPRPKTSMFDFDSSAQQMNSNIDFGKHGAIERKTCKLYDGQACSRYLAGKNVLISEDQYEIASTERIVLDASQVISNSSQVSQPCKRYAEKAACFHNYHVCDPQPSSSSDGLAEQASMAVLQICRRDCLVIEKDLCPEEYATARSQGIVGKHQLLPDCSELSDNQVDRCSRLLGDFNELPQNDQRCYRGNGANYRGTASTTESGKSCQKWFDARRKFPRFKSSKFLELTDNNYCRNPGGEKARPWCFNSDGYEQYCKMELCPAGTSENGSVLGGPGSTGAGGDPDDGSVRGFETVTAFLGIPSQYAQYVLMATGMLGVLLVAIFIALICKLWRSRSERTKKRPRKQVGAAADQAAVINGTVRKPGQPYGDQQQLEMMHLMEAQCDPALQRSALTSFAQNAATNRHRLDQDANFFVQRIPSNLLPITQQIGEGRFGSLWLGTLKTVTATTGKENNEDIQVVLKILKDNISEQQKSEFEQECVLFSRLQHPNLVQMLGVSVIERAQCVAFEFRKNGDLHEFLLLRSPYNDRFVSVDSEQILLDHGDFLHIATQIASGMQFLTSNQISHGDLSSRNCLLADRLVVKICVFGGILSGDVMVNDRYVADYCAWQQTRTASSATSSSNFPPSCNFTASSGLSSGNFSGTSTPGAFLTSSFNAAPGATKFLPLRWMSPEALMLALGGKHAGSEASDVWAFGVTLWEMYAYGARPYANLEDAQVFDAVRQRCLLECPSHCPPRMYSLMVECWHEMPGRRPSFAELLTRLQTWSIVNSPSHSTVGPLLNQSVLGHLGPAATRASSVLSGGSSSTGNTHGYSTAVASHPTQLSAASINSFSRSQPQSYLMGGNVGGLLCNGSSPNLAKLRNGGNGFTINVASQAYGFSNADVIDSSSTLS